MIGLFTTYVWEMYIIKLPVALCLGYLVILCPVGNSIVAFYDPFMAVPHVVMCLLLTLCALWCQTNNSNTTWIGKKFPTFPNRMESPADPSQSGKPTQFCTRMWQAYKFVNSSEQQQKKHKMKNNLHCKWANRYRIINRLTYL